LECENFLKLLPLEYGQQIKLLCLDFYKTIQEMLKHLPYMDPLFKHLTFLDPKIVLYDENRIKIKDLSHIAVIVEDITQTDITQLEWRILSFIFDDE